MTNIQPINPKKEISLRGRWAPHDSVSTTRTQGQMGKSRPGTIPCTRSLFSSGNVIRYIIVFLPPRLKSAASSRHHRQQPSSTCACGNDAWSHPSSSCAWPSAGTTSSYRPSSRRPFCARNVSWAPWFEQLGTTGAVRVTNFELQGGTPEETDEIKNKPAPSNSFVGNVISHHKQDIFFDKCRT